MIGVLAAIGAGTTLTALGLITYLVVRYVQSTRELIAACDLVDSTHAEISKVRSDLEVTTAALKVKTDQYEREQKLRIAIEVERNSAFVAVRKQIVEHIKNARSTTDANRLIADLLSLPLGVQTEVREGRGTAPGPDSLIDPFAEVQSP